MADGAARGTPELRAMVEHGNDSPFGSDGGGLSFHAAAALRRGASFAAVSVVSATPELKRDGDVRSADPLRERGRIVAHAGRHGGSGRTDWSLALRGGLAGGAADRAVVALRERVHSIVGIGNRPIREVGPARLVAGIGGHWRVRATEVDAGPMRLSVEPYAFAAMGTDAVEGGGALMLALQRQGAEAMAPWLPETGGYAPLFGGNGLALFAAARASAYDDLWRELGRPFVATAGVLAQASLGPTIVALRAACSTGAYEGGPDLDCYAAARTGVRF